MVVVAVDELQECNKRTALATHCNFYPFQKRPSCLKLWTYYRIAVMLGERSEAGLANCTKFCCASHSHTLQCNAIARFYSKLLSVAVCPYNSHSQPSHSSTNILDCPHVLNVKGPDKFHALFHGTFCQLFLYSCNKLNVKFFLFIAAIWLCYAVLYKGTV